MHHPCELKAGDTCILVNIPRSFGNDTIKLAENKFKVRIKKVIQNDNHDIDNVYYNSPINGEEYWLYRTRSQKVEP